MLTLSAAYVLVSPVFLTGRQTLIGWSLSIFFGRSPTSMCCLISTSISLGYLFWVLHFDSKQVKHIPSSGTSILKLLPQSAKQRFSLYCLVKYWRGGGGDLPCNKNPRFFRCYHNSIVLRKTVLLPQYKKANSLNEIFPVHLNHYISVLLISLPISDSHHPCQEETEKSWSSCFC